MRSTIICVDDDKWLLNVLSDLLIEWLGENYTIEKALSAPEALDIIDACLAEGVEVSLVISDYIMPGMKGDALLEQVKIKTPTTRRIMLTGFSALEGIVNAINKAGIYRYLSKPWDNKDMMLTVLQAIRSYEQDKRTEKLAKSHEELYRKFESLSVTLQTSLKQTVGALSAAAESRENDFPGHSGRVADYSVRIAKMLKNPEINIKNLETAALLHDVGRIGLKDLELRVISNGMCYENNDVALRQAEQAKTILSGMDPKILPGVIYHMERMDGLGPYGLNAQAIPLEARLIGLCNYYDVLSNTRSGETPSAILGSMVPDKGKIFDAVLFDVLLRVL